VRVLRRYFRAIFRIAASSLLGTLVLVALSWSLTPSGSFLGQDITSLATGIIRFYPETAYGEMAKLLFVAAIALMPLIAYLEVFQRSRWPLVRKIAAFAVIYSLLWLASAIAYPAMYEASLSQKNQKILLMTARHFSPVAIQGLVIVLILYVSSVSLRRRWLAPTKIISCTLLGVAGVGVLSWSLLPQDNCSIRSPANSNKPNIALFAIDSLRADRLLQDSSKNHVLPFLKRFADAPASVAMTEHYVGIPRTFPSWVEILTGQQAPQTDLRHMFPNFGVRHHLPDTFVEQLHRAGYRTILVSDFAGDIFPRMKVGFDIIDAPKLTIQSMIGLSVDQAFPLLLPVTLSANLHRLFPDLKESPSFADPRHLTQRVMHHVCEAGDQPIFLLVFYSTAHFPYASHYPGYLRFTASDYQGKHLFSKNPELKFDPLSLNGADVAQVRALFDGALASIDQGLETLMLRLGIGTSSTWLTMLTADHGEDLYENGLMQGHGEHLRGVNVLKVPWIVNWPNVIKTKLKIPFPTRSIDIGPTLLGLIGLDLPTASGSDLSDFILNQPSKAKNVAEDRMATPVYAETGIWFSRGGEAFFQKQRMDYPGISQMLSFDQGHSGEIVLSEAMEGMVRVAKHRMLLLNGYKLIYIPTDKGVQLELYDVKNDPDNLRDLSHDQPDLVHKMYALLKTKALQLSKNTVAVGDYWVPTL